MSFSACIKFLVSFICGLNLIFIGNFDPSGSHYCFSSSGNWGSLVIIFVLWDLDLEISFLVKCSPSHIRSNPTKYMVMLSLF